MWKKLYDPYDCRNVRFFISYSNLRILKKIAVKQSILHTFMLRGFRIFKFNLQIICSFLMFKLLILCGIFCGALYTVCKMANFARNEVGSHDLNMVLRRAILGDLRRAGNSGR